MRKKFLIILLFPLVVYSQKWTEDLQETGKNFYEIQDEFNKYWDDKPYEKGKGWKQFKRWENFMEKRVYPDGEMKPEILYEEYLRIQNNSNPYSNNIWTQVGPVYVPIQGNGDKRGIGRVNAISFHPTNPDKLYIGAPAGGFWKSENGGQTWSTSTDFLNNLGVSDIAINPSNPDEIFIITGDRDGGDTYSYGLMKSVDGGNTFNTTGLSFNITNYYRGNRVLIDPINTNVIIVSTSNGIYRSVDGGINFTNTFSSTNMTDIEFHTTNSNIVYGASKGNTSIYKSTDNGISWSQSGSGLPLTSSVVRACVAVTPDNPSVVYALFGDNNNGFYAVYKSLDEGQNWVQQSNSPNLLGWSVTGSDSDGQAWYDLAFACDPNDENILFVGGVNTWKSIDGGQSWNINTHWYGASGTTYMHADEHMLKYNPINDYIYSGNDGGLYVSTDNGNNWTDISDGLQITQFYSLGVSQTVQDLVITGSQDNGTFLKSGNNWDPVIGGDGMECIIDYTNSNIMYGALYYGDVRKSTNGGNSFSSIAPANNGAWETPYILDRNDPNIIYIGYDELYKSTDGGNNWNTITNGVTNGNRIDEIAISKSNPSRIYFADGADLYVTNNGGNSWNDISSGLPNKTITYIAVHPTDPDKIWITLSGYTSSQKVYKSQDGGNSWSNYSGTLPNIPVNTIVLDENSSSETLYIGTDLGVFIRDNTSADWSNFNNLTLPNVIVSELEIQYQSNKLIAATYGRGLWSIDLQITSPPSANFFASDSIFCNIPSTVDFTNTSFYSNSYYWDFGDGNTSTSTNPSHTYTSFGTFTVSLIATGPLGMDSIISQSLIDINANNPCIITMVSGSSTQTACSGTLYDVGGPNGNYFDNNDSWVTISPIGASQVTVDFLLFDLENSTNCIYDYVEIFDGNTINSPSLGQFCNNSPGTISSSGGAITILLHADAGVNGQGFEMDWTCTYPSAPPVTLFAASDTMSCNGTINFTDLSSNGPTSWLWDFGDGNTSNLQNPSHTYQSGGVYSVSLTTTNQYGTNIYSLIDYVNIMDLNLSLIPDSACGSSSLVLQSNSSNNNVKWYSDPGGQNLLFTGPNYTTPVLNNSTTYYAQAEMNFSNIFGGPSDNTFGAGGAYQGNRHLIFDNYSPSKLVSVLVYAYSDGNRTIELRNSSGTILMDTNIFIPSSINNGYRLYLNFDLPVQNDLQLGISGNNNDMFRNSNGAQFPYTISNLISITGTNASAGYYYFFYDWEIEKEACNTNLLPVEAIILEDYISTQNIDLCNGGTVTVGNNTYGSTGLYTDVLTAVNGCDSIIITDLTVGTISASTTNVSICSGSYYSVGSSIYTQTGQYTDTLSNGICDSIINTNLTVHPVLSNQQNYSICSGDSILISGQYYLTPIVIQDTFVSLLGCDSIVSHQLNVIQSSVQTNLQSICSGETYTINNNIYSQQGSYTDILSNSFGCDSIVNTILTVFPTHNVSNNVDICLGDSIMVGNNVYYTDGIYTDVLLNGYTCDSIIITYLSVSDLSSSLILNGTDIDASALNGISPYTYDIYGPNGLLSSSSSNGGILQFTPLINGVYYFIVTDAIGCVSDTSFMYVDFAATSIYDQINFKEIDKIVDILGREVPFRKNTLLVFIYKDGTVERKILFK